MTESEKRHDPASCTNFLPEVVIDSSIKGFSSQDSVWVRFTAREAEQRGGSRQLVLQVTEKKQLRATFFCNNRVIRRLIAIVQREDDGNVALCPEVDVASQGDTVAEALILFFETTSEGEVDRRLHGEVYVTHIDIAVGQMCHRQVR